LLNNQHFSVFCA